MVIDLWSAFLLDEKGGGLQQGLPGREVSEKICRKVAVNADQALGRSGKMEESRLRNIVLGQAFREIPWVLIRGF